MTLQHLVLAGLFAFFAVVAAAAGWWEALHLDPARSMVFARPGQPIETGWQPLAVGVTSIVLGGGVALGILRRGFSDPRERLFLGLLLAGMSAWAIFGMAGIYAGFESFARLEQPETSREHD